MLGSTCRGVLSEMWGFGEDPLRPIGAAGRAGHPPPGAVTLAPPAVALVRGASDIEASAWEGAHTARVRSQTNDRADRREERVVRDRHVEDVTIAVEGDAEPLVVAPERLADDVADEGPVGCEVEGVGPYRHHLVAERGREVPADEAGDERGGGLGPDLAGCA